VDRYDPLVDTQAAGPESPNVIAMPPQGGAQHQPPTPSSGRFESAPENAVDLGLLDELTTGLSEVQDALARLDNGTYGHCEHCGDEIDDTMLDASPTARLCAAHLPFGHPGDRGSEEPRQQA
jgi:Prokaryotic dksA/traR C4-type zinc finger